MFSYQRSVSTRLWLLRIIFSLLLLAIIRYAGNEISTAFYLFSVGLFFGSFITITGLSIQSDSIAIKRFYFFGLLSFNYDLSGKTIKLFSFYDRNELTNGESLVGCFFILFPIQAKFQGMSVYFGSGKNEKRIRLNDEEYQMVQHIIK